MAVLKTDERKAPGVRIPHPSLKFSIGGVIHMAEPKYKIGDSVIVVHREETNTTYSYTLNGAIGFVNKIEPFGIHYPDEVRLSYIYQLSDYISFGDKDDTFLPMATVAWYGEESLDPYLIENVDQTSFEEVFE